MGEPGYFGLVIFDCPLSFVLCRKLMTNDVLLSTMHHPLPHFSLPTSYSPLPDLHHKRIGIALVIGVQHYGVISRFGNHF